MSARGLVLLAVVAALMGPVAGAQPDAADARSAAPIDLTGFWVNVVTEDWRWRAVTAKKGDYASVPLNAEGIRVADAWDGDETSCLPYGAPSMLRIPTRIEIAWTGPNTLEVRTEQGAQTRELLFGPLPAAAAPSRQGVSAARWDGTALEVRTTRLSPGYLRRNGVPYSASTEVIEYFNTHSAYGDEGFTVTTIVRDPVYLDEDFVTSTTFLELPDGADWRPVPCNEPSSP